MHIVFLIHAFPVNGLATGGAGNYVANMAQIMQKNGHKVSVITEAQEEACVNWNGIDIYYIRATRGFKNTGKQMSVCKKVMKNLWRSIWYNRKVQQIDKKEKIDIVQSANAYGIALFRKRNIPYIIRMSSYPPLWGGAEREQYNFEACLKTRRLDEELQLLAMKRANCVISPSKLIGDITAQRIGKQIEIVESPVLIENADCLQLNEPGLEKEKYFITFGANENRKSIRMLVDKIDDILDKYPDMKYVIIGRNKLIRYQGDYAMTTDIFAEKIVRNKERFVFLGEISDRQRLFSIVKHAAVCILPTRIDNLPNTVLEAMALGKVVISSTSEKGTSVEQLITDGENGFLIPVDDGKALMDKINHVMNLAAEERNKITGAAVKRVKDLIPEKVYSEMLEIYKVAMKG